MSTLEKKPKEDDFSSIDLDKLKQEKTISEEKLKLIEASIKGLKVSKNELQATLPREREISMLEIPKDQRTVLIMEFEDNLPEWVNKPWMYVTPKKSTPQIESWLNSWSAVILDYSRILIIHIVNINDLRNAYPFKNQKINKTLSIDQVKDIIDYLEVSGFSDWIQDKEGFFAKLFALFLGKPLTKKLRAKIIWRTNEEFADDLLKFMIETGRVIEIHSLYDLTTYDQAWSSLPADELRDICNQLVERGSVKWLNKEKTIVQFESEKVF